jgi:hypothetical protein
LLVVEAAEAWIWAVEEVVEVYCTFRPYNLTQAPPIPLQWVLVDMEHQPLVHIEQMALVRNQAVINTLFQQLKAEIVYLDRLQQ